MKEKRKIYGIRKKIILCVTIVFSILFLSIFLTVDYTVRKNMFQSLSEQYLYTNQRIMTAFETNIETLDQLTEDYILNEYVQKTLTKQKITQYDLEMMKKSLGFLNESFLDYYLVIDNKGNFYSQKNNIAITYEKLLKSNIYSALGEEYSKTHLLWERDVIFGTNKPSFFAVRYIQAIDSYHEPGVLILKLNQNFLKEIKESIQDPKLYYFMLSEKSEVCFSQLPDGKSWDAGDKESRSLLWEKIMNMQDGYHSMGDGIRNVCTNEETGFSVITYAPREISNALLYKIQRILSAIFIGAYMLAVVLIVIVTRRMTGPILFLSQTMRSFGEDTLDKEIVLHTNTELDDIGTAYNKMLQRVRNLMRDVKRKEAELRESELKSLMYQIRPHFLYNTLDTIYMLARIEKQETIMKMIQALSCFLRINLSNGKEEISVEKELEHAKSYLEIQQIRNADLFEFQIEAEEEVKELPILKMLLQPIVENGIKHGFKEIYEGGKIWIRAFCEKEMLCLSVMNNGETIETDSMEKLNAFSVIPIEEMDFLLKKKQGGYGIGNIVKRLRIRYGDEIMFFYYVPEDGGTGCEIRIPIEKLSFRDDEVQKTQEDREVTE